MTDRTALADALRGLLGPGVGVGVADPTALDGVLLPEEEPATARMTPARLREFTAGRTAARAAMAAAGLAPLPVPMAPDRAPVWPAGVIGSIAHCRTAAIAAVARPGTLRTLGLDIEEAAPLEPELWHTVMTPPETASARAEPDPGVAAKQIFVVKEAVYKAQYPITGAMLEFHDLDVSLSSGSFDASLQDGRQISGQLTRIGGLLLATVIL